MEKATLPGKEPDEQVGKGGGAPAARSASPRLTPTVTGASFDAGVVGEGVAVVMR